MRLSNETYDTLQRVARLIIPFVIFLTSVGDIWGLEWMAAVTATISAFGVFLGAALQNASNNYKKDKVAFNNPEELEDEPEEES